MLTYNEATKYILNRPPSGSSHDLEKISRLLEYLDKPQDKIKVIHVAGTNGKGSTANFLSSVFSTKLKCGLFTSPYMVKINENIKINGIDISDQDLVESLEKLMPYIKKLDDQGFYTSYFELMTAIMYIYFYEKKVDIAIVEVGLGGSLDSTNVIRSNLASVITTISMDHTNILGDSIEEIALNKAGIIKENRPTFLYPKSDELLSLFRKQALEKNSKIYTFRKEDVHINYISEDYNSFDFLGYKDVRTKLTGLHQIYNASLALKVVDFFKEDFNILPDDIYQGFKMAKNPGRLELISDNPKILIDGAHNKEAIDSLSLYLENLKYDRLILGFSILKDKEYPYIIKKLSEYTDQIVLTKIKDNPRAFRLDELASYCKKYFKNVIAISDNKQAFTYTKDLAGDRDLVLWCGSLYLVGEILKFKNLK